MRKAPHSSLMYLIPHLVVLFREVLEPSEGGSLLEKVQRERGGHTIGGL